jgi:hypothetical protein
MSHPKLEALAEANDQLHWGKNIEEIEGASRLLRDLNLNISLAEELEFKALIMREERQILAQDSRVVLLFHERTLRQA